MNNNINQNNKFSVEELATFCKKKGFIYPSSEIYGGLSGVYDYGHIGTMLKRKFENEWKKYFLNLNDNFVEIDTGLIMHEGVFKASGHLENFYDPIISIEGSDETYRADHIIEDKLNIRAEELTNEQMLEKITINKLLGDIDYSKVKIENLNMMFPVDMGPKKATKAYLRPETAQSPYVNFKNQFELQRKKLPLGLALIGRVFRNEIAPRNMLLRTRELEQAELQIFFNPNKIDEHENFNEIKDYNLRVLFCNKRDSEPEYIKAEELLKKGLPKFYVYHMAIVQKFFLNILKTPEDNFRLYQLNDEEKAFYNKYHFDIEIKMNSTNSWVEVGGIHYRTDHDLKGHQNISKVKMEVVDESNGDKIIPHVLELSFGLGRNIYSLIDQNLELINERGNSVLFIPTKFSPISVSVFPLVNKAELPELAQQICKELKENSITATFDKSGSVGRRYARADEIGTSYCITIDFETIEEGPEKNTVTIRDRNTTKQKRIAINNISETILKLINNKITFDEI